MSSVGHGAVDLEPATIGQVLQPEVVGGNFFTNRIFEHLLTGAGAGEHLPIGAGGDNRFIIRK